MPNEKDPLYTPTPEQIEREKAKIREGWSLHVRCNRASAVNPNSTRSGVFHLSEEIREFDR